MSAEGSLTARRIATLCNLRTRWIAEYPAILVVDPERARHHAEAVADLDQLIANLTGLARSSAVFESV